MSKTVSAVITLVSLAVPAGTVVDKFRLSLVDGNGVEVATQDTAETTASFADVGVGTYKVTAVGVDAAGALVGSPVSSDPFTIEDAPTTVTVNVPGSVTVSLS